MSAADLKGMPGRLTCAALAALLLAHQAEGQAKRSRQGGLSYSLSSSTAGEGNLHLTLFGRSFLWDNAAAQRIPPMLPHAELNYGATDYLDVTAGINALSYVLQPGGVYLRAKATTPDNKSIRFIGAGLSGEVRKSLLEFFPSNGFRVKAEGFGPEGFIFGNGDPVTSLRVVAAVDMELIRISSWLPFKLYGNAGWEGAFASFIEEDNAAWERKERRVIPEQDFSKLPLALGLELKTYSSDFFVELEAEPFASQVFRLARGGFGGGGAAEWSRFEVVNKKFDVHYLEMPVYANTGAKLKYGNGLEMQGGMSWMLSRDEGPKLGPCNAVTNPCREGATDGYSPFYPQWKVFWLARYPLRFTQPSSELYRSFLLKRYQDKRKRVNLDATLAAPDPGAGSDEEERRRKLEKRRKEADGKSVDLN